MTLVSINGGIDVIFDEIPYMKILLKKYGSEYRMVLPIYRTGGFGFAFQIGSPLVTHFSKVILDVTQGPEMTGIENKNFGAGYTSLDPFSSTVSQRTSSLDLPEFYGLFIIFGSVVSVALVFAETNIIGSLKKYISGTSSTDISSVQQSGTGPSHGLSGCGVNTSREAPAHSGDKTKDTGPTCNSNDPQDLETDGSTASTVPQTS